MTQILRGALSLLLCFGTVSFAACEGGGGEGETPDGPALLSPLQVSSEVFCAATTPPKSTRFLVSNSGTERLEIMSATATGGFVVQASVPDIVQPGAAIAVTVTPPAAVVGTDRVGATKRGTLTVTSNDPGGPREIQLFADVRGAAPAFEDADGKAVTKIDLRSPNTNCPNSIEFELINNGVRPLTIDDITGPFSVTLVDKEDTTINPGESLTYRVNPDSSDTCVTSGTVTFALSGGTCATSITLPVTQLVNGTTDQCFCGGEVPTN